MKHLTLFCFLLISFSVLSQEKLSNRIIKSLKVLDNTIAFDTISVSPFNFKLLNDKNIAIDTIKYKVNFAKAYVQFVDSTFINKNIIVEYEALPEFLTKTYKVFDTSLIVDSPKDLSRLYSQKSDNRNKYTTPFGGLETNGSLSRGITMGNNQDGVLNSNFDLQINGNLSSKVKIRANITDNNVPLQENGYTQRLSEFDRVFIELFNNKWKVTAGDINFSNTQSAYLNFKKKVAGLSVDVNLKGSKGETKIYASGALVKGKFTKIDFNGLESNQGPYKLATTNTPFLLIISGSETVYVNGIPLKRGETNDYTIDYNTAEITFNTTYPINSDMRIHVEFQASDQNYSRFVTFNEIDYQSDKLNLQVNFYNENDSKNKTLQQDLSDEQQQILTDAGDDLEQMNALSAVRENYIENKIQYKKEIIGGETVFVLSTNTTDELYAVRFSLVGSNQGNYIISNTVATGRVYEYIAPIAGVKQGSYESTIRLIAPNKLQITTIKANFKPNKKMQIATEIAYSTKDENLFSDIDDSNNQGFAGRLNWQQLLLDNKWKLKSVLQYEKIQQNFNSVERINRVEFNRDWNIANAIGNQDLLQVSLTYENEQQGFLQYQLENLTFSKNFKGLKHQFISKLNLNKTEILLEASSLSSTSTLETSDFNKLDTDLKQYIAKKVWIGARLFSESNIRKEKITEQLSSLSHKSTSYDAYFGVGDSTKVNIEIGCSFRRNDSVQLAELQNVNKSNTYYLKSKLIQNKTTDLGFYLNYRALTNRNFTNEESINTRLHYRQQLADNFITLNTVYEASSGVLPQQEFNYVEVEPGLGFYTWIDFNNDGVQDLDEFEIAQFQDQAIYVRVLLPTIQFIKTNQTKFSQLLNINPSKWRNASGIKKTIAHFFNQTTLQIDNKYLKTGSFQLNPFETDKALSIKYNVKNNLFFNRGKQHYSTTYSYIKLTNKTAFVTGTQENNINSNQIQFQHKLNKQWLLSLNGNHSITASTNERYTSRNYKLLTDTFTSKIAYFHNKNTSLDVHYNYRDMANSILLKETLKSNKVGVSFKYSKNQKLSLITTFDFIDNTFVGNQNSPVAFQMLEGLQRGKNYTWTMIFQKKLTNYLDVNLNYNARKSPDFRAIHTGTVQLRANF